MNSYMLARTILFLKSEFNSYNSNGLPHNFSVERKYLENYIKGDCIRYENPCSGVVTTKDGVHRDAIIFKFISDDTIDGLGDSIGFAYFVDPIIKTINSNLFAVIDGKSGQILSQHYLSQHMH